MGAGLGTLLRFAGVGLVTTLLDLVLFSGLIAAGVVPKAANLVSYSCGIALSYALNRRWTFGAAPSPAQAAKFVAATLAGLALSTVLVVALAAVMPPVLAKILSVPLVFLWNYAASRLWVFRPALRPRT